MPDIGRGSLEPQREAALSAARPYALQVSHRGAPVRGGALDKEQRIRTIQIPNLTSFHAHQRFRHLSRVDLIRVVALLPTLPWQRRAIGYVITKDLDDSQYKR